MNRLAYEMWKSGTAPNKNDYEGMPDWQNHDPVKRKITAQKAADVRRASKVKITVPPVPWEDPEV